MFVNEVAASDGRGGGVLRAEVGNGGDKAQNVGDAAVEEIVQGMQARGLKTSSGVHQDTYINPWKTRA